MTVTSLSDSMLFLKEEIDTQEKEEPSLDALVHCTENLKKIVFPFPEIRHLRKFSPISQCLIGCLAACKTRCTETLIVGEISHICSACIGFKHLLAPYLFDDLEYLHVTDAVFQLWIDELVMRGEPLPLSALYLERKMNVLNAWKQLREMGLFTRKEQPMNDDSETETTKALERRFGRDTQRIMVTPWHLVQLSRLGRKKFERVVVGLYVCCVFTVRSEEQFFIERIRKVTWGALPYEVCGEQLSILLHFESPNAGPCPVFAVQCPSPEIDRKLIQNRRAEYEFIPPTERHIAYKSRQFQEAMSGAMDEIFPMNETDEKCFNRTAEFMTSL